MTTDLILPAPGGTVKNGANPNAKSHSSSAGNSAIRSSGKKGGGVKVPRTGGTKGKTGSGYNR